MKDHSKIPVTVDADLEDLVPDFLLRKKEDAYAIIRLLAEGDYDRIRILGHSMKGAGGGYGFHRITEIGGEIEKAALSKDRDKIVSGVDSLTDFLERVDIIYA